MSRVIYSTIPRYSSPFCNNLFSLCLFPSNLSLLKSLHPIIVHNYWINSRRVKYNPNIYFKKFLKINIALYYIIHRVIVPFFFSLIYQRCSSEIKFGPFDAFSLHYRSKSSNKLAESGRARLYTSENRCRAQCTTL